LTETYLVSLKLQLLTARDLQVYMKTSFLKDVATLSWGHKSVAHLWCKLFDSIFYTKVLFILLRLQCITVAYTAVVIVCRSLLTLHFD